MAAKRSIRKSTRNGQRHTSASLADPKTSPEVKRRVRASTSRVTVEDADSDDGPPAVQVPVVSAAEPDTTEETTHVAGDGPQASGQTGFSFSVLPADPTNPHWPEERMQLLVDEQLAVRGVFREALEQYQDAMQSALMLQAEQAEELEQWRTIRTLVGRIDPPVMDAIEHEAYEKAFQPMRRTRRPEGDANLHEDDNDIDPESPFLTTGDVQANSFDLLEDWTPSDPRPIHERHANSEGPHGVGFHADPNGDVFSPPRLPSAAKGKGRAEQPAEAEPLSSPASDRAPLPIAGSFLGRARVFHRPSQPDDNCKPAPLSPVFGVPGPSQKRSRSPELEAHSDEGSTSLPPKQKKLRFGSFIEAFPAPSSLPPSSPLPPSPQASNSPAIAGPSVGPATDPAHDALPVAQPLRPSQPLRRQNGIYVNGMFVGERTDMTDEGYAFDSGQASRRRHAGQAHVFRTLSNIRDSDMDGLYRDGSCAPLDDLEPAAAHASGWTRELDDKVAAYEWWEERRRTKVRRREERRRHTENPHASIQPVEDADVDRLLSATLDRYRARRKASESNADTQTVDPLSDTEESESDWEEGDWFAPKEGKDYAPPIQAGHLAKSIHWEMF